MLEPEPDRAMQRHTTRRHSLAPALGIETRPLDDEMSRWENGAKTELSWTVPCPPARGILPGIGIHGLTCGIDNAALPLLSWAYQAFQGFH